MLLSSTSSVSPQAAASLRADVEHFAELLPIRAAPALQLQLRPDHVAGRAGIDRDARHRGRKHEILQVFGLLDDILAGKVIAALLEDLLEDQALLIAGQIVRISDVRPRQILVEESAIGLHARVVTPFRIGRILVEGSNDHPNGLIEAGRLERCRYRTRWKIDDQHRLPSDLGYLANGLRREFRRAGNQKRFGSRTLQIYNLRIHGWIGDFVGGRYHLPVEIALEECLEGVDVVFAEIIVLIKDGVFGVRQCLGQILGVDLSFRVEADQPRRRQRKIRDVGELVRAADDGDGWNAFQGQVFGRGGISRRAELAEDERDLVALDKLADMLHRFRRTVGVVHRNIIDLAAVYAAAVVHGLNVGKNSFADQTDR